MAENRRYYWLKLKEDFLQINELKDLGKYQEEILTQSFI